MEDESAGRKTRPAAGARWGERLAEGSNDRFTTPLRRKDSGGAPGLKPGGAATAKSLERELHSHHEAARVNEDRGKIVSRRCRDAASHVLVRIAVQQVEGIRE